MKILVLQLARLGDIYQTWPVLQAIKRTHPTAEVHLLTREKFAAAAPGAELVHRHWLMTTKTYLKPLVEEKPDFDTALGALDGFCSQIRAENFDQIINLSFSPFSSYMTREVSSEKSVVRGYTRFSDGYLAIPDDGSAYFYAQVGVGRANRVHVTDLFAFVAGVEILEEDWRAVADLSNRFAPTGLSDSPYIVIHVGASQAGKTLSWSKWLQLTKLLLETSKHQVVLVGSVEEVELAERIAAVSGPVKPINLVGQTSLKDLQGIIANARLVIGGDSAPVHIASIANTMVLNISLPSVSFWETGPKSKGSRIFAFESENAISAEELFTEAMAMFEGRATSQPTIRVPGPTFPYIELRPQPMVFEWDLLRAVYMSEPFPAAPSDLFTHSLRRLSEVNQLALEQVETLRKQQRNKTASALLEQADVIMDQIIAIVPQAAPMLRWFQTERLRIGPMAIEEVIEATELAHKRLESVLEIYVSDGASAMQTAVRGAEGASRDDIDLGS